MLPEPSVYPVLAIGVSQLTMVQPELRSVVEKPKLQLIPGAEAVAVTEAKALSERSRPPPDIRS